MNKDQAAKTLVEIISMEEGPNRITNQAYQTALLTRAIHYTQLRTKEIQSDESTQAWRFSTGDQKRAYEKCMKKHQKHLKRPGGNFSTSNYIFVETKESMASATNSSDYTITTVIAKSELTYFAIIGEPEIEKLQDILKGDLRGDAKKSAETLGITEQLQIDYTQLLKEKPSIFCDYFKRVSDSKRKEILSDNWEHLNNQNLDKNINHMLSNMFKNLIEDVGRDRIVENE